MRVLRTMNSVGEIKKQDLIGLNINDIKSHHRRSRRTLDKVYIELLLLLLFVYLKKNLSFLTRRK
jgi:hypothetical protein